MYRENRRFLLSEKDLGISQRDMPAKLEKISTTRLGLWEINTLNRERVLPEGIQRQAVEIVNRWTGVFPKEPTWIQENFGIPSLIVRIDGVDRDGELGVYEVEERPAGIGHTALINPKFASKLEELRKTWPDFDVVISPLRDPADDKLWNPVADLSLSKGLVYVRAEPEEEEFHVLQNRSVSTITTEGDKSYGVPLGLWSFVNNPDQLPTHQSFVLKPLQGSKGRNVIIHDLKRKAPPGNSKMKNVIKMLETQIEERGGMYMQTLILPMESGISTHPFMIYRFFLGFDFAKSQWISLGGTYFARNNLKIHGASDSLSGPLVIA